MDYKRVIHLFGAWLLLCVLLGQVSAQNTGSYDMVFSIKSQAGNILNFNFTTQNLEAFKDNFCIVNTKSITVFQNGQSSRTYDISFSQYHYYKCSTTNFMGSELLDCIKQANDVDNGCLIGQDCESASLLTIGCNNQRSVGIVWETGQEFSLLQNQDGSISPSNCAGQCTTSSYQLTTSTASSSTSKSTGERSTTRMTTSKVTTLTTSSNAVPPSTSSSATGASSAPRTSSSTSTASSQTSSTKVSITSSSSGLTGTPSSPNESSSSATTESVGETGTTNSSQITSSTPKKGNLKDDDDDDVDEVPIIIGVCVGVGVLVVLIAVILVVRNRRKRERDDSKINFYSPRSAEAPPMFENTGTKHQNSNRNGNAFVNNGYKDDSYATVNSANGGTKPDKTSPTSKTFSHNNQGGFDHLGNPTTGENNGVKVNNGSSQSNLQNNGNQGDEYATVDKSRSNPGSIQEKKDNSDSSSGKGDNPKSDVNTFRPMDTDETKM